MSNEVIVSVSEKAKEKLRDFDEQTAYFLLLEIFSYAQATKNYAKFQTNLAEWKRRYPIDLFSENLKQKIKYMLSKEFLNTILKDFIAFDELSKKDPSKGLEKLRNILDKTEKHKNEKQLNTDLQELYSEYPLKFLKEKYPHLVTQLLSKSNITRLLEKFDSSLAFQDLKNIVEYPQNYADINVFTATIKEWEKLYPVSDFNDKFQPQVNKILSEFLDNRKLEELFPVANELDLTEGQIIPLEVQKSISLISKNALYDFFKIVDKNAGDINSLFDWSCKYSKHINNFDANTKNVIISNLMARYANELPPVETRYSIPHMEPSSQNLLSLNDYTKIGEFKKSSVIQLLGILSTGDELTSNDIYRLNTINENVQLANNITSVMKKAKIEPKLDLFMEKFPEDKLTPSDDLYLKPTSNISGGGVFEIQNIKETEPEIITAPDEETELEISDLPDLEERNSFINKKPKWRLFFDERYKEF